MQLALAILVLLLLFSSAVGGVVFWKKDTLFGSDDKDTIPPPPPTIPLPKTLGEPCLLGNSECEQYLTCDTESFTCRPVPVPVDCEGNWEDWSECVYPTDDECATIGEKTQRYTRTNDGPKHGGAACPVDKIHACGGRTVPSTCNMPCVGEWDLATCPLNQCGGTTLTETYNVVANAVGNGADCPHSDKETRQKNCTNPCTGPPVNCVGDWAAETCGYRGCGAPSLTKTKAWIKTADARNGGSCALENETQTYVCPATNACHRGEDARPTNARAKYLFKNKNKKVRIFRVNSNGTTKECLSIGGSDGVFDEGDDVGFNNCDRANEDRLNTWRVKDNNYLETWHTTDKFKLNGRDQPLCLDYNNDKFKLERCDKLTGNDQKNRTQTILDHDKMTWPRQAGRVHDAASYRKWLNIAPAYIQTGHSEKCIRNAGGDSRRVGDCNQNEELYITDHTLPTEFTNPGPGTRQVI